MLVGLLITLAGCAGRPSVPPSLSPIAAAQTASRSPAVQRLAHELTRLFSDPAVGQTVWGVQIRSLDRDETLYSLNDQTLLIPASTIKILTLVAAAEHLGWDFTFETLLLASGPVENGTLQGDLLVRGSGDPTIGIGSDVSEVFLDWAAKLQAAGIREISGRIIGDGRSLGKDSSPGDGLGSGWAWDDLAFGFAAPGGGLQLRENTADIILSPGVAPGTLAQIRLDHPASGLTIANHVATGPANSDVALRLRRLPGQSTLELRGSIPSTLSTMRRRVSVDNPTLYFVSTLRDALEDGGVRVAGDAVDIRDVTTDTTTGQGETSRVLVRHQSAPLSEYAVAMMKRSQNLVAETLFRALRSSQPDGSGADSQEVIAKLLDSWSVRPDHFIIADGSGLSRYNYLTAMALVRVLEHMRSDPSSAPWFEATLPVAGRDGTLANRLTGTPAEGHVRAKTGSMSNVSALSGYADTPGGETLVFAILANNYGNRSDEVTRTIDRAVSRLASFAR